MVRIYVAMLLDHARGLCLSVTQYYSSIYIHIHPLLNIRHNGYNQHWEHLYSRDRFKPLANDTNITLQCQSPQPTVLNLLLLRPEHINKLQTSQICFNNITNVLLFVLLTIPPRQTYSMNTKKKNSLEQKSKVLRASYIKQLVSAVKQLGIPGYFFFYTIYFFQYFYIFVHVPRTTTKFPFAL